MTMQEIVDSLKQIEAGDTWYGDCPEDLWRELEELGFIWFPSTDPEHMFLTQKGMDLLKEQS